MSINTKVSIWSGWRARQSYSHLSLARGDRKRPSPAPACSAKRLMMRANGLYLRHLLHQQVCTLSAALEHAPNKWTTECVFGH